LCNKYGPRIPFAGVLMFASIPTGMTGLVQNEKQLYFLRLFIGSAGGSFVMCQYWCSRMFAKEVVGTANSCSWMGKPWRRSDSACDGNSPM
jgi:MFS transporter, NNP family, nitrate/nitrite transporter